MLSLHDARTVELRDQSRLADSRLSRTLSLQRRRGVERAALAAGTDVAGGKRPAGREHWLSLRLSQQRQLYPRLFASVRHGANRDAADGGRGMSGMIDLGRGSPVDRAVDAARAIITIHHPKVRDGKRARR